MKDVILLVHRNLTDAATIISHQLMDPTERVVALIHLLVAVQTIFFTQEDLISMVFIFFSFVYYCFNNY